MVYLKRFLVLILCSFVITGCFNKELTDSVKFKKEYEK